MKAVKDATVGDVATLRPGAIPVFDRHKIDYCCGGEKDFNTTCRDHDLEPAEVLREIENEAVNADDRFRPVDKTMTEIVTHILGHHHAFTRSELARLQPLGAKVLDVHGGRHPELTRVVEVFSHLAADLGPHMLREEQVLFPYILQLDCPATESALLPASPFGTVANPIRMMRQEHEAAGQLLDTLRELTCSYTVPDDACTSYRAYLSGLQALEKDLHDHIHLENNVLFPAAELAEAQFSHQ